MRWLVERLARNRSFVRTLDIAGGRRRIVVSPDARLAYLKPGGAGFDRALIDLALRHLGPGKVAWDVGANVGLFSLAAVAAGARAVAVEADIWLAGLIRRTSALNGGQITVVPAAISDRCGTVDFEIAERGRASNAIAGFGRSQTGGVRAVETVASLTLDTLLDTQPPPDFVKIDVEGAEHLVFAGAGRVLDHRPVIQSEIGDDNREPLGQMMRARGYRCLDANGIELTGPLANETLFVPE